MNNDHEGVVLSDRLSVQIPPFWSESWSRSEASQFFLFQFQMTPEILEFTDSSVSSEPRGWTKPADGESTCMLLKSKFYGNDVKN